MKIGFIKTFQSYIVKLIVKAAKRYRLQQIQLGFNYMNDVAILFFYNKSCTFSASKMKI